MTSLKKKTELILAIALAFLSILAATRSTEARPVLIPRSYEITFAPVGEPKIGSSTTVRLTFTCKKYCSTAVDIEVTTYGNIGYKGETKFTAPVNDSGWVIVDFPVSVPDNDTTGIYATIQCPPSFGVQRAAFFVSEEGQIRVFPGYPGWGHPPKHELKRLNPSSDTTPSSPCEFTTSSAQGS